MNEIIERMEEVRTILKLNKAQLSQHMGFGKDYYGLLVSEKVNISKNIVKQFCDTFYVNEDYILNGTGLMTEFDIGAEAVKKRVMILKEGYSITEFARKTGVNQALVSYFEEKDYVISKNTLKRIANAYDVSYEWLVSGDESKKKFPVNDRMIKWLWEHKEEREELWKR